MDSESLRLILLVLGVLLVAGIYLWDRYKRSARGSERIHLARKLDEPAIDLPEDNDVGEVRVRRSGGRREPYIEPQPATAAQPPLPEAAPKPRPKSKPKPEPISELTPGLALDPVESNEQFIARPAPEPDPEPTPERWDRANETPATQGALDFEAFNAHGDSDYLNIAPELLAEVPRMIVQISIMSKAAPFPDESIRRATAEVGMKYGEMNIYHRLTDAGQTLFSMASVVEPGTFPKKPAADFSTPGMTLFTQLPGARDGLAIYSDMLFTAERIAVLLGATLHDEAHNKLTKQSIEHTRQTILDHRHQIQLLRSRH